MEPSSASVFEPSEWWLWTLITANAVLGLVALVDPRSFGRLARRASCWIDTSAAFQRLDTRIDVDHLILPYARLLGALVIGSAVAAAIWRFWTGPLGPTGGGPTPRRDVPRRAYRPVGLFLFFLTAALADKEIVVE